MNAITTASPVKRLAAGRGRAQHSIVVPLAVLVVLMGAVAAAEPSFLGYASLKALAAQASLILMIAVGQTLIVLMGSIDLSVAALASFASILLAKWLPGMGVGAVVLVIVLVVLSAAGQGLLHAWCQAPSFVITLGGLSLWAGLALTISKAATLSVYGAAYVPISWAFGDIAGVPRSVVVALALTGVVAVVMHFTSLGRYVYAIGNAERAAALSGVRTLGVRVLVFSLGGLCAAITSISLVAQNYTGSSDLASSLLLPSIAAVVIGGTAITGGHGGLARTVVGALIIATLRVGMSVAGVDPSYEQIVYGAVLILAITLTTDRSKLPFVK